MFQKLKNGECIYPVHSRVTNLATKPWEGNHGYKTKLYDNRQSARIHTYTISCIPGKNVLTVD